MGIAPVWAYVGKGPPTRGPSPLGQTAELRADRLTTVIRRQRKARERGDFWRVDEGVPMSSGDRGPQSRGLSLPFRPGTGSCSSPPLPAEPNLGAVNPLVVYGASRSLFAR